VARSILIATGIIARTANAISIILGRRSWKSFARYAAANRLSTTKLKMKCLIPVTINMLIIAFALAVGIRNLTSRANPAVTRFAPSATLRCAEMWGVGEEED